MKRLLVTAMVAILCMSCAPKGDQSPYPKDSRLTLATMQRREFVDSFLQGYWCEAMELYAMSIETSIRRDAFCEAAATAELAARLKSYAGQEDTELRALSDRFLKQGINCNGSSVKHPASNKDSVYRNLIDSADFDALLSKLDGEDDALYRSVYARTAVSEAYENNDIELAKQLLELARATDAAHGWVTFLVLDWNLAKAMTNDPQQNKAIDERIASLKARITPCD